MARSVLGRLFYRRDTGDHLPPALTKGLTDVLLPPKPRCRSFFLTILKLQTLCLTFFEPTLAADILDPDRLSREALAPCFNPQLASNQHERTTLRTRLDRVGV